MSDKALSLDGAKTLYNDLRARVTSKAESSHSHAISDVTDLQIATVDDYNSLIDFADTSFPAETFVTLTTGTTYNYTGN